MSASMLNPFFLVWFCVHSQCLQFHRISIPKANGAQKSGLLSHSLHIFGTCNGKLPTFGSISSIHNHLNTPLLICKHLSAQMHCLLSKHILMYRISLSLSLSVNYKHMQSATPIFFLAFFSCYFFLYPVAVVRSLHFSSKISSLFFLLCRFSGVVLTKSS